MLPALSCIIYHKVLKHMLPHEFIRSTILKHTSLSSSCLYTNSHNFSNILHFLPHVCIAHNLIKHSNHCYSHWAGNRTDLKTTYFVDRQLPVTPICQVSKKTKIFGDKIYRLISSKSEQSCHTHKYTTIFNKIFNVGPLLFHLTEGKPPRFIQ